MRHSLQILLVSTALASVGCGSSSPSSSAPPPAAAAGKKVDAATAGSVSGRVVLEGPAPAPEMIRIANDPACIQALGNSVKSDALLVAADGAVQNAFVYIKDTLADYAFDVPAAALVLDQKGCRYEPRIFGVRVGQAVDILNSDPTLHNVHALPMVNAEFNKGQPAQGSRMTQVFTAPEVMVRFKCDVHSWMSAYGGIMSHPFFAVTAADGTFSLKGLPPGTYELAVWHEKLGTKTQTVTIGASQAQTANFSLTVSK